MPVDLRGAGRKKSRRRNALQLIKWPHLAPISQWSVIIGVNRIPAEGWLGRVPLLVEVAGAGIDIE
jgi:hypothetical protein